MTDPGAPTFECLNCGVSYCLSCNNNSLLCGNCLGLMNQGVPQPGITQERIAAIRQEMQIRSTEQYPYCVVCGDRVVQYEFSNAAAQAAISMYDPGCKAMVTSELDDTIRR